VASPLSWLTQRRKTPASRNGGTELQKAADSAAGPAGDAPFSNSSASGSASAPAQSAQNSGAAVSAEDRPRSARASVPRLIQLSREGSMESVSLTDEGVKPCSHFIYYDVRGLHLACQLVCHVAAAELADRRAPIQKAGAA